MCPGCVATLALIVAGASSIGGLATLAVKKLQGQTGAKRIGVEIQSTENKRGE